MDFDNDASADVAYSTSHLKRTWKVRFACTKHVHLRFRLSQVTFHLLDFESPLFEPSIGRGSSKHPTVITM